MGQCLSTSHGDTPEKFKGRWQPGGLGEGLPAYDPSRQYGGLGEPIYTTNADVGMKPREDKGAPPAYGYMPPGHHDNGAPPPLQLERIEEDATLRGCSDGSPLKPLPPMGGGDGGACGGGLSGGGHVQRKPISWTRGELVGQGAFGSVFVALDNDTGELIAVKQVQVPRGGGGTHARKVEENVRSVEEEVALLQQFDHPNIVRYLGTEKTEEALNIFLEYVPGGSIASLLAKFGSFKESVVKLYTKQLLLGLEYLHSKGVMHRDIKGANILVDNTGLVKLADFGASKKLEDLVTVADGNKSVRGTPYWMAPEVIKQEGHGRQADLWSVACTVLEMATGRPPWSAQYPSQVAAMFHIASSKGPPEIPQHLSPECKDFLYLCFNRDWKARPLATTLLRHPFLANVQVRSQPPAPSLLAQAWRAPRASTRLDFAGGAAAAGADAGDSQFGTPSPLNPKLANPKLASAARISIQASEGGAPGGDGPAALSPLGAAAIGRRPQWDSAATAQQQQVEQQQQQQQQAHMARAPSSGRVGPRSPIKQSGMSLRASAPAFGGYASVELSDRSEQLPLRQPRPAAPALSQQQASSGNLRGSRESGSVLSSSAAASAPASAADATSQQHTPSSGSGSELRLEREASDAVLPAAAPQADEPAELPATLDFGLGEPLPAEELQQVQPEAAAAAGATPAVPRQRPAVQDLLEEPAAAPAGQAAAPNSAGNSSGTNNSDYNPMEEPSWMHPHESPLAGEGTPTSALTGGAVAAAPPPGALSSSQEASSCAAVAPAAPPPALPAGEPLAAPLAAAEAAAPAPAAAAAAAGVDQHPSHEHIVWTNEDGDIDALPWDMGGWSTGSSGEQQRQAEAGVPAAAQEADPVDEDALIGALRRKANHDVRASMALFEKSLNIPALHAPASPKSAAVAAAAASTSPRTIAAVHAVPAPHVAPAPLVAQSLQSVAAESIEAQLPGGGAVRDRRQQSYAPPPAAPALGADDSRRRSAAVQHLLSGVRQTATGSLPPPSPLAAAVGGLAELSSYGRGGPAGGAAGNHRESVWQQELSQELFRLHGAGGGAPNRRTSMHGSPLKAGRVAGGHLD